MTDRVYSNFRRQFMDSSIVLRKTEKGIIELKTREHRLAASFRVVLSLVDGKADIDGLRNKAPSLHELGQDLRALLKEGYIVMDGEDTNSPGDEITDADLAATRAKWDIVEMVAEVLGEDFAQRATKRLR